MAKLEELFTKGEPGDRDCAIATIESILDSIKLLPKVPIRKTTRVINEVCHPNDAIYFTSKKIYIPEKIVDQILGGDTYLSVEGIVEILSQTRYAHRRIIPEDFYDQIHVVTPIEDEDVDCLILNYPVFRRMASDLFFE